MTKVLKERSMEFDKDVSLCIDSEYKWIVKLQQLMSFIDNIANSCVITKWNIRKMRYNITFSTFRDEGLFLSRNK
jgi:hypothetical protein